MIIMIILIILIILMILIIIIIIMIIIIIIIIRARNKGVPGAKGSLEFSCGSLRFLLGAQ